MIEDVINEVRELFLDEGVDEQVLLELKTVTDYGIILPFYSCLKGNWHFSISVVSWHFPPLLLFDNILIKSS